MSVEEMVFELPEKESIEEVKGFMEFVSQQDKFGVKGLSKNLSKYLNHIRLADDFWEKASKNVAYINGYRASSGPRKPRLSDKQLEMFYSTLSTAALRSQCQAFGLHYDDYNAMEDIITDLVKAHKDAMKQE